MIQKGYNEGMKNLGLMFQDEIFKDVADRSPILNINLEQTDSISGSFCFLPWAQPTHDYNFVHWRQARPLKCGNDLKKYLLDGT